MRRLLIGSALAALVASCQGDTSAEWTTFENLGFEMHALDGWDLERQRHKLVYSADPEVFDERVTISILASKKPAPDAPDVDPDQHIIDATTRVIRALPEVRTSEPKNLRRGSYEASALYDLSYQPRGKEGRYERRHVVLVGTERVFHIVHTAPEGLLAPSANIFADTYKSLREIPSS